MSQIGEPLAAGSGHRADVTEFASGFWHGIATCFRRHAGSPFRDTVRWNRTALALLAREVDVGAIMRSIRACQADGCLHVLVDWGSALSTSRLLSDQHGGPVVGGYRRWEGATRLIEFRGSRQGNAR